MKLAKTLKNKKFVDLFKYNRLHVLDPNLDFTKSIDQPDGTHIHFSWEIKALMSGSLRIRQGRSELKLKAPALVVIPPGVLHCSTTASDVDKRTRYLNCLIEGEWVELRYRIRNENLLADDVSVFKDSPLHPLTFSPAQILDNLCRCHRETGTTQICNHLIGLFFQMLTNIATMKHENKSPHGTKIVAEVNARLAKDFNQPELTIETIAREVGLTCSHLTRIYREITGTTPRQHLIELRLNNARELIRAKHLSLKEIAYLTGFRNSMYFSSAYRKRFGKAPSKEL